MSTTTDHQANSSIPEYMLGDLQEISDEMEKNGEIVDKEKLEQDELTIPADQVDWNFLLE